MEPLFSQTLCSWNLAKGPFVRNKQLFWPQESVPPFSPYFFLNLQKAAGSAAKMFCLWLISGNFSPDKSKSLWLPCSLEMLNNDPLSGCFGMRTVDLARDTHVIFCCCYVKCESLSCSSENYRISFGMASKFFNKSAAQAFLVNIFPLPKAGSDFCYHKWF